MQQRATKDCQPVREESPVPEGKLPVIGKMSVKPYKCTNCGKKEQQSTNHWGFTYGFCYCGQRDWECQEPVPEGMGIPEKWKKVKLGDMMSTRSCTSTYTGVNAMSSIILDKEKGLNLMLTQIQCIVCGETKDDAIMLLGNRGYKVKCPECNSWNYGGLSKTGTHMQYGCNNPDCDYTQYGSSGLVRVEVRDTERPVHSGICRECEGYLKEGVAFIAVLDSDVGSSNPTHTGPSCIIKDKAVKKMIKPKELLDDIMKRRICYVPDSEWDDIGLPREDTEKKT